jgi:hypothetical protein
MAKGSAAMPALKNELEARLPMGSSSDQVEAYLAEQGLSHSGLIDNAKLAHMGLDGETYEIKSIVRGGGGPALVRTDTSLTFVFDRARKLAQIRVEPVHTGL